jgi:hypothetical protein
MRGPREARSSPGWKGGASAPPKKDRAQRVSFALLHPQHVFAVRSSQRMNVLALFAATRRNNLCLVILHLQAMRNRTCWQLDGGRAGLQPRRKKAARSAFPLRRLSRSMLSEPRYWLQLAVTMYAS